MYRLTVRYFNGFLPKKKVFRNLEKVEHETYTDLDITFYLNDGEQFVIRTDRLISYEYKKEK